MLNVMPMMEQITEHRGSHTAISGGGEPLLCFNIDCDAGFEVYGEAILEDGDLFNQAADQRLIKLCDGEGLALDKILQIPDLLHLFIRNKNSGYMRLQHGYYKV